MKQSNRFASFFALLLLSLASHAQDTGQQIRISQGRTILGTYRGNEGVPVNSASSTSPATVQINDLTPIQFKSLDAVPNTVGNRNCTVLGTGTETIHITDGSCGWYKAFWIFGDGNFKKFENNLFQLDTPSLTIAGHRYAQQGIYNPVVYLTEKYHNSKPPEAARATINVTGRGAAGSYTEITRRFQEFPDHKVYIDYNHEPRVDYPMNFVLSYRNADSASAVLFYYNTLTTSNFETFTPTHLLDYKWNEWTNYQGLGYKPEHDSIILAVSANHTSPGKARGSDGTLLDALNAKFRSRLIYDVRKFPGSIPTNMTELRVFPVLQTLPAPMMPDSLLRERVTTRYAGFATILIGQDSVGFGDTTYGRLIKNATTLFGPDIPKNLRLGPNLNLFIKGIELLNLKMETSHDPNSLIVRDIRDLGGNRYRVTFQMTICNKGQGTETKPSLVFNDLTGGKYSGRPQFGPLGNLVTTTWSGGSNGTPWEAELARFNISGIPSDHYLPSCRELTFTLDTDADGVARLYQEDPRALKVCVKFSGGIGECSENDALPEGTYLVDGKYLPADVEEGCNWLLWALLILVLIAVLWFFFKSL